METSKATVLWKYLNGVINVYKPAGVGARQLLTSLQTNLCKDLNSLDVRPTRSMVAINPSPDDPTKYDVDVVEDLSDHVLCTGPRYLNEDIVCSTAARLGFNTSGVFLVGLGTGRSTTYKIREANLLRTFHVTGLFGMSTETNFKRSLMLSKASYSHIYPDKLAGLLAAMQASHQKKMFEMCGVDMQSQTAYEIACRGLIRPVKKDMPVVYGIRCIKFKRPEFVIEVHTINENEDYLFTLIQEIGIQMRSVAHCIGVRCVRYGPFSYEQSLLRSQYWLEEVITNLKQTRQIIKEHPEILSADDPDVACNLDLPKSNNSEVI